MNFKEKLLVFIKRTKYKNLQYAAIMTPIVILLLVLTTWMGRTTQELTLAKQNTNQRLTMTMVGDVMLGRYVENVINQNGYQYLFQYVKPYFHHSDYISGNFEHPVLIGKISNYTEADKEILLHVDPKAVSAVKNAGFTVMSLANNHLMDYGEKGLQDTLEVFESANMDYVGAGENIREVKNHINYQDVNGVKVATLGFTDVHVPGSVTTKERGGVLSANPDQLFDMIEKAKSPQYGNADLVVVNVHWGEEYESEASPRQKALAKAMVDAGADVIVGHHPHVLQSFDVYKQSVIFYSLGNFIFDQGWTRTKDSAMVQYHLSDEGKAVIDVVPIQIQEAVPKPATGYFEKERIFRQLTKGTSDNVLWSKRKNKLEIYVNQKSVIDHMKKREEKEKETKRVE